MKKSVKPAPALTKPTLAKPTFAKPSPKAAAKAQPKAAPAKKTDAPTRKKAVAEPPATFISARIDIGFGNHLYIRGEGPGLSWDIGAAMDNTGSNLWTTSVKGAKLPVVFKVLVNDLTWNTGTDYVVNPGQSITVHPSF